ncbi:hypothetical protein [Paludisphaera rhizosphaerae]|uniref:hypothetical protein n=1 Tax=Paludisphaera rhizosphaerae TaxID=2711216 RepID=UPI0013EDD0C2|nr:hypothetical protein [Paludisphaera rhizosphaerae]
MNAVARPIGLNDIIIAAIAFALANAAVVTMDSELASEPGRTVVDWATPSQPDHKVREIGLSLCAFSSKLV